MSRDASPSGRNPSYGTISPRLSNIKAARKSLSPPMSDITMRGIADEPGVSLNQDQDSLQGDEDEHVTSENTPLVTSPTSNSSETSPTGLRKRHKTSELPYSVCCDCHEQPKPADKASQNKLIIACVIVLVFMIGEVVGWLGVYCI